MKSSANIIHENIFKSQTYNTIDQSNSINTQAEKVMQIIKSEFDKSDYLQDFSIKFQNNNLYNKATDDFLKCIKMDSIKIDINTLNSFIAYETESQSLSIIDTLKILFTISIPFALSTF
jgi:hypothetical protein